MAITFNKPDQIIVVTTPNTEVTIQELVYAIRDYEDTIPGMDIFKIADASGKEPLGSGLFVGITLKLIDWKIQFEDRPGPNWILCDIQAGNLLAISGSDEVFINPVEPSAFVTVTKPLAVSAALISAASLPADVADAVWDEPIADHQQTGSTGEALLIASQGSASVSASVDIAAIVDGVWNAQQSDYTLSGSFGELLAVVSQSVVQTSESVNLLYDNIVYISSSVDQNGVYLQQVSSSVNLIYDQTSYITSSVDNIYAQTTDISQSIVVIEGQITDISQSVNDIQVDTGSIAQAVWSEDLTPYTSSAGSAGGTLYDISQNLSVSGSSPDVIADAVWDEILSQHTGSANTAASIVGKILGLVQNNFRMVNMVYDSNNLMTSANLRVYTNSVDAQADTNHLYQWDLTAVYDSNGRMTSYVVSE